MTTHISRLLIILAFAMAWGVIVDKLQRLIGEQQPTIVRAEERLTPVMLFALGVSPQSKKAG